MINKIALSVADALADVKDGATVLIDGLNLTPQERKRQTL